MSLGLPRDKVFLVPHDPAWQTIYLKEEGRLKKGLGKDNVVDIQHFGSTSIAGIAAKPLMGILLIVKDLKKVPLWDEVLSEQGYLLRESSEEHFLYAKGPDHKRTIHLHVAENGSEYAHVSLLFRDYLRRNPDIAKAYEKLKFRLAEKYTDDRRRYTSSKDPFIKKIIATARQDRAER